MKGDKKTKKRKKLKTRTNEDEDTIDGIPIDLWNIVYQRFEIFLNARGYSDSLANEELLKINTYIHRACTYSRKRIRADQEQEQDLSASEHSENGSQN